MNGIANLTARTGSCFIVPASFEAYDFLIENGYKPAVAANRVDELNFILHSIGWNRYTHNHTYSPGLNQYVQLNQVTATEVIGSIARTSDAFQLLVTGGVIERDEYYIPAGMAQKRGVNAKSYGYRITSKYRSKSTRVAVTTEKMRFALRARRDQFLQQLMAPAAEHEVQASQSLLQGVMDDLRQLRIRDVEAIKHCDQLYDKAMARLVTFADHLLNNWNKATYEQVYPQLQHENQGYDFPDVKTLKGALKESPEEVMYDVLAAGLANRHQSDLTSIQALVEEEYFVKRPDHKSRVYTNLANLSSHLRPFLGLEDAVEGLVNIDIKNSQPLVLGALVRSYYYTSWQMPADAHDYIENCENGKFYEQLMDQLSIPVVNRKKFKVHAYTCLLFGKTEWMGGKIGKAFTETYPSVAQVIRYHKRNAYQDLAIALQRTEAGVIIDHVVRDLQREGIWNLTIHDSVVCRAEDQVRVRELVLKHFQEIHHLIPSLTTEPLKPEPHLIQFHTRVAEPRGTISIYRSVDELPDKWKAILAAGPTPPLVVPAMPHHQFIAQAA